MVNKLDLKAADATISSSSRMKLLKMLYAVDCRCHESCLDIRGQPHIAACPMKLTKLPK